MSDRNATDLPFPAPPFVPTRPPRALAAQPAEPGVSEFLPPEAPGEETSVPEQGAGDPVAEAIAGRLEEIAGALRGSGIEGMLSRADGAAPVDPLEIFLVGYALGCQRASASEQGAESVG